MAGLLKSAAEEKDPRDKDFEATEGETAGEDAAEPPAMEQGEEQVAAEDQGGDMSPQSVRAKMNLPDNLKDAYDRVVLAGMKMMFSEETHQMAMKTLQGQGPIDERLAQGVAALMGTLITESNNTMPPAVVIPAGIELIAAAGDFLKQGGSEEAVTDDDIAGAMADYVQIIFQQAGAETPEQMQQMLQGQLSGGGQAPAPQQEQPPAAPKGLLASEGA